MVVQKGGHASDKANRIVVKMPCILRILYFKESGLTSFISKFLVVYIIITCYNAASDWP